MVTTYSETPEISTRSLAPRIVATHWLGEGAVTLDDPATRLRFQRLAGRLHELGPRPVGEFIAELVETLPVSAGEVIDRLERYGQLDPATVRALGADRFPPVPLRSVAA